MFKFGDEVIIDIDHVPNTSNMPIAPGTTGRVVSVKERRRTVVPRRQYPASAHWSFSELVYAVSYHDGTYWFAEEHLSPKGGHKLPEPLFDLDDMELAEILLEELREK